MKEISENNPYVASRLLWDDLYGGIQTKLENSYRIILMLALTLVIAISVIVYMAAKSQIKPYVVMLRGHELVTVNELKSGEFKSLQPKLAMNLSAQFIKQVRTHSIDQAVNHENKIAGFSFASGAATTSLQQFYTRHAHDANLRVIEIHTILIKSVGEIDIRWVEYIRNPHGDLIAKKHYSAELNYQFTKPSIDPIVSRYNPLGFYITDVAWTKDLMEEA